MANENIKIKGYKIDLANNEIVMNYKFSKQAEIYGTPEYKLLKKILKDFPFIEKNVKSGRTKKAPRYNKNFTYDNMYLYLSIQENSKDLIEKFVEIKKQSKGQKSPYKFVKDWFVDMFPDYRTPSPKGEETKGVKSTVKEVFESTLKKAS